MLTVVLALHLLVVGAVAQQDSPNIINKGMTVVDNENGAQITKPPGEKWKCYDKGSVFFGEHAKLCVSHVIDFLSIEIAFQQSEQGFGDLDKIAKSITDQYEENIRPKDGKEAPWKEVKFTKKDPQAKLPGLGRKCYELEATITDAQGGVRKLNEYIFTNKNTLVRVAVVGAPEEYKKKQREVISILGTLKFFNPAKKK